MTVLERIEVTDRLELLRINRSTWALYLDGLRAVSPIRGRTAALARAETWRKRIAGESPKDWTDSEVVLERMAQAFDDAGSDHDMLEHFRACLFRWLMGHHKWSSERLAQLWVIAGSYFSTWGKVDGTPDADTEPDWQDEVADEEPVVEILGVKITNTKGWNRG
jgi:hypothetical protein